MSETNAAAIGASERGVRGTWNHFAERLTVLVSDGLIALAARIAVAAIFFLSGRTKVDGLLTVNDNAYTLFREEYKVPLLPPELAAHLATYAEHLFPALLVVGLLTRLSAALRLESSSPPPASRSKSTTCRDMRAIAPRRSANTASRMRLM